MVDVSPRSPSVAQPAWSREGEKPRWSWVRRRAGWLVFAFPAILALTLIANGARQAGERGSATDRADVALKEAFRDIPFKVRLPQAVPLGAPMVRVILDKPDSKQGFQAFQLTVWYTTKSTNKKSRAETIQVWQTNDKYLARRLRDPLQLVGEEEIIAGQSWRRVVDTEVPLYKTTTFSKRYDDGITLTVGSEDPELARQAVATLATANG
jgi:hypothetical protein